MTSVALVFRSMGERSAPLALELAKRHLSPEEVHVLDGVRPFSETVRRMVNIDFRTEQVVAVDADCLMLEDMRPFLEVNRQPYVDSYVDDRFRGRLHAGVHITRVDVMREMRQVAPPTDDPAYVLRPESRLRKLALKRLGFQKCFRGARILHDHLQWRRDLWSKYALRELRSRTPEQRRTLDAALVRWARMADDEEVRVAEAAVVWARTAVPAGASVDALRAAVESLVDRAPAMVEALGVTEPGPLTEAELEAHASAVAFPPRSPHKVFGVGLSRTGTRSLTSALHILGVDTVHYPIDDDSLRAMASGDLDFQLLEGWDGLTDITVAPYYRDLERRYPNAKFVLTVRDEESWLDSCARHWAGRDAFAPTDSPGAETHMKVRRFLRAAVYGTYGFHRERFRGVYRQHVAAVKAYFADKPGKLLVLDVVSGAGWAPLAEFLGRRVPDQPFPHKGGMLRRRMEEAVDDPDD